MYRLDLHEDTERNVVIATFEFPGFSKDEVDINFQNGKLTVSAETKTTNSDLNGDSGYTLKERLRGKFSRTLRLPQGVQVCHSFINLLRWTSIDDIVAQGEQIKATMENGLLTVTFPKTTPEFAPKKIVIQASEKEDYETDFNFWNSFFYHIFLYIYLPF